MQETMREYQSRCKYLVKNGCPLIELNEYRNFKDIFSSYEFKKIMNEKQKRKNKRHRTKKKYKELYLIKELLIQEKLGENAKIVFGTLTLDNEHLSKKEDTYIRKINKWLKDHFIYCILNKDYGKKNEREHYHFIGLTIEELIDTNVKSKTGRTLLKLTQQDYELGFEPTLEIIDEDIDKTVNYLLKLNNHSNKIGTRSRVRIVKSNILPFLLIKYGLKYKKGEIKSIKKEINYVN